MHNIKEFIDMNEKDFDSFFNILDNSFPKSEKRDYPSQKNLLSISNYRHLRKMMKYWHLWLFGNLTILYM